MGGDCAPREKVIVTDMPSARILGGGSVVGNDVGCDGESSEFPELVSESSDSGSGSNNDSGSGNGTVAAGTSAHSGGGVQYGGTQSGDNGSAGMMELTAANAGDAERLVGVHGPVGSIGAALTVVSARDRNVAMISRLVQPSATKEVWWWGGGAGSSECKGC